MMPSRLRTYDVTGWRQGTRSVRALGVIQDIWGGDEGWWEKVILGTIQEKVCFLGGEDIFYNFCFTPCRWSRWYRGTRNAMPKLCSLLAP